MSFWRILAAVVLGVLIAGAIGSAVAEYRRRAYLASALEMLNAESARANAQWDEFHAQQRQRAAQQHERVARQRAAQEAAKPPRYPAVTEGAKPGKLYCLNGYTVRRVENGWDELLDRDTGKRYPCRAH